MSSRRFVIVLALMLSIGIAAPSYACSYDCTEGLGLNGNSTAFCWESLNSWCSYCSYSDCAVRTWCYRYADGSRDCFEYCDGQRCFLA
jgi:hypothetical protein